MLKKIFLPKKKIKNGQALIEVLFAVGVIGVCLTALMTVATFSLRTSRLAKEYALANKYAEEGLEIARRERDNASSWQEFLNIGNRCEMLGEFQRCFNYTNEESNQRRRVTVRVTWQEGGKTHQVETVTFLSRWSR